MAKDENGPTPGLHNEEDRALSELRKTSEGLKTRITEAKRRNDMPLDSALGNPHWEERAADGSLDLPDDKDDD